MNIQNPLVSIVVITYNSAKHILETLESAKAQTYQQIELIVSDDCSTDDTTDICRNWIEANRDRFVRAELIVADKNTGIAPNCNRGIRITKGEWIKLIAGDDILLPECIQKNYTKVKKNNEIRFLFSNIISFIITNGQKEYFKKSPLEHQKIFFNIDPKLQYLKLLEGNFVSATPSSFIHRQSLVELALFDEDYPFMEDYPLWLKCTQNNIPLCYFDADTVLYRYGDSITRSSESWISLLFYKSLKDHYIKNVAMHLKHHNLKLFLSRLIF
jgi:glycosyltransferase involved in cell wall biosynthesis